MMKLIDWLAQENMQGKDFAEKIGKTPPYVSQIIQGKVWPSKDVFQRIKKVTKGAVTPNDFLER